MKVAGLLFWLFTLFQISCGNESKNLAISKNSPVNRQNTTISKKISSANCMSESDESSYDFDDKILFSNIWLQTPHIENKLPDTPPVSSPTIEDVRNAINFAFKRIPRRGTWFKSYTASKPVKIYAGPNFKSLELGRVKPQSRFAATGYTKGTGCKGGWLRIGLKAYICMNSLHPDKRTPTMDVLPIMKKNSLTPGKYAYVRIGGSKWYPSRARVKSKKPGGDLPAGFFIHFKRFTRIAGKNYWKTVKNRYIPVNRLARFIPSKHMGVILNEKMKLPVIFPIAKNSKGKGIPIPVYDKPRGNVISKIPYHKAVHIYGQKKTSKGKYYRIGRCQWVSSRYVSAAFPTAIPPGVKKGEQWIDINLIRQTLVAYRGSNPIFATIISSGKGEHPTKRGVFRVWWKTPEIDMKSEAGSEEAYLASSVPWTMFFWKGQALHGAYWHDDFGKRKSHGCINLAPKDARFLYEWSTPFLGAGWKYEWTGKNNPGITIQIRKNDSDRPMIYGLARNFIPKDQLELLDLRYKNAIKEETLKIIKGKSDPQKPKSMNKSSK